MPSRTLRSHQQIIQWTLLALAAPLALWVTQHLEHPLLIAFKSMLRFHSMLELLAIMVAVLIFVTGYRAIGSARKGSMVFLALLFLSVGALDFLNVMSDIGVAGESTLGATHPSHLLWLAARMLAAGAPLVYLLLPDNMAVGRFHKRLGLGSALWVVGIFWMIDLLFREHLSELAVTSLGWVSMDLGFAWLVIGIHLINFGVLWHRRVVFVQERYVTLCVAVGLLTLSDLLVLTLGLSDKEGIHVIGHAYMVAAYLVLFQITLNESLRLPLARMTKQYKRENLALSISPNGVMWINSCGKILEANHALEVMTGFPAKTLMGKNIDIFLPASLRDRRTSQMQAYFATPHPYVVNMSDVKLLCSDGRLQPVDISIGFWEEDGERQAIAYIRDLSEQKKLEATLLDQATHDKLTGLPNRGLFCQQLNHALARANSSGKRVAVLLLDLDGFKTINDSFGHITGDDLLVQAGRRMRTVVHEIGALARLGGDEFAIWLDAIEDIHQAVDVAAKLLVALSANYQVQGLDVYLSGSLGLAFSPDDGQDGDTLLRYADIAMYHAKAAGRGTYCLYAQEMQGCVHEDMQIHMRLKEAIRLGTLDLYYQPQVDVMSGAIVGAEALLRWMDPVLGRVSPARFIPIAETTGLILSLSDWVLETACTQIAAWMQAGTPLRVAVNFSAQQFRLHDLSERVADTLKRTGAQAHWLDIEITESLAMTHPAKAVIQLNALVALGCRVALDDFGTGYSSLAYLKVLPIHKLKIDKSFMDGVPHDANDVAISCAIIALAHNLSMKLIAEGVETDAQLAFLRQHGCEAYQGWLFAKAMTAAELTRMLRADTTLSSPATA